MRKKFATSREVLLTAGPVVLLIAVGFWIASQFVQPAPPQKIVVAAASKGSPYYRLAEQYQKALAQSGITLEIKDDGSYTGSPSRGNPFTGQLSLNGGQLSFRSSRPATGTVILLEGDGERILRFTTTQGSTDFTAVK